MNKQWKKLIPIAVAALLALSPAAFAEETPEDGRSNRYQAIDPAAVVLPEGEEFDAVNKFPYIKEQDPPPDEVVLNRQTQLTILPHSSWVPAKFLNRYQNNYPGLPQPIETTGEILSLTDGKIPSEGLVSFEYSYTDPATGESVTKQVELDIPADADVVLKSDEDGNTVLEYHVGAEGKTTVVNKIFPAGTFAIQFLSGAVKSITVDGLKNPVYCTLSNQMTVLDVTVNTANALFSSNTPLRSVAVNAGYFYNAVRVGTATVLGHGRYMQAQDGFVENLRLASRSNFNGEELTEDKVGKRNDNYVSSTPELSVPDDKKHPQTERLYPAESSSIVVEESTPEEEIAG